MTGQALIILALLIPAIGVILIALTSWQPNLRETTTLVTAVTLFGVVITIFGRVMDGEQLMTGAFQILPGLDLAFKVEPLGMLFACVASGLWIVNSIYSIGYMRGNK